MYEANSNAATEYEIYVSIRTPVDTTVSIIMSSIISCNNMQLNKSYRAVVNGMERSSEEYEVNVETEVPQLSPNLPPRVHILVNLLKRSLVLPEEETLFPLPRVRINGIHQNPS